MTDITVAALQLAFGPDIDANIANVSRLVREAAAKGAQVILPPELFEGEYFCRVEDEGLFATARPVGQHKAVLAMQALAGELKVAIPTSFFEADGPHHYNSLAMIGPDGKVAGVYRKSHIPDGPGYEEKFYFRPGNTGFKVWDGPDATTLGVGICWDQWFPETARAMALLGAELLFFPTAIGSEPQDATLDSRDHWQRTMQGHAAANLTPLIASNRIGTEPGAKDTSLTFYGSSFIADHTGGKIAEAGRAGEAVLTASFDLDAIREARAGWGVFRDRRPELYGPLLTLDGKLRHAAWG
jgi:N-carbamoylputrescine amidase